MRKIGLVLILITSCVLAAQDEAYVLRTGTTLVPLQVSVFDARGIPVTDLQKSDFAVYEDGERQELTAFETVPEPYSILLLIDVNWAFAVTSTANGSPFLSSIVDGVNRFTGALRPQDRISIATFMDGEIKVLVDWRSIGAKEKTEIRIPIPARSQSGTHLSKFELSAGTSAAGRAETAKPGSYALLNWVAAAMKPVTGRKGVLLFSDVGLTAGQRIPLKEVKVQGLTRRRYIDAAEDKDFQRVSDALHAASAPLYSIAVNSDLNPWLSFTPLNVTRANYAALYGAISGEIVPSHIPNLQQVRSRIELLAERTAGRVVYPRSADELPTLYEQIARELGTSYSLAYRPKKALPEGRRLIEVRVPTRRVEIRQSRTSYDHPQFAFNRVRSKRRYSGNTAGLVAASQRR